MKMTLTTTMDDVKIDQIIDKHNADAGSLIQILLEIQRENNWLPKEVLSRVSERLDVPMSRIRHITTFYKTFSLVPKGRKEVYICTGTACHVRGADSVLEAVENVTGVKAGETDPELKFCVDTVGCIGCCALGPVVVVDGEYHGNITPGEIEGVLNRDN